MTAFSELDRVAFGAIEGLFGEAVRIIPRTNGLSGPMPDPDRPPANVTGVFTLAPDAPRMFEERREGPSARGATAIQGTGARLTLGATVVTGLVYKLRTGDAVRLLSRPGEPVMGISRLDADDVGSVTMTLVREIDP
jgi:hypothetical protein